LGRGGGNSPLETTAMRKKYGRWKNNNQQGDSRRCMADRRNREEDGRRRGGPQRKTRAAIGEF